MRPARDPYRELGVPRGATDEQIKAAHRRLAKRYHPDASSGERERFLAVQEAYLLLSDPLRRREWDARHAPGPVRASPPTTQGAPMARSRRGTRPRPDVTDATARSSRGTTTGRGAGPGTSTRGPAAAPEGTGPARTTPGGSHAGPDGAPAPGGGSTTPGGGYTWSAAGVPWWEDFQPRGPDSGPPRAGGPGPVPEPPRRPGPAGPPHAPDPTTAGPVPSASDVYSRSSGTAWSSAARRYFRKADEDLPRGGQFVYRGTQVVTGAEARRVADEELRRARAAAAAAPRPAASPSPSAPVRPSTAPRSSTPPRPSTPPHPTSPRPGGLRGLLRRLFGD